MPSPMHGKGPSVQKPKDFKGSLKKIVRILAPYKFSFILGLITAVISVVISVVGPKIMGNIITEIANGFMAKVQGTGGIDFDKIFILIHMPMEIFCLVLQMMSIRWYSL